MIEMLLILVTGIATGFLNVMAGGGSMLSVPIMIFLGLPSTVANATNRVAILPQNITATVTFYRQGFSNLRLSLSLAACTIPGAIAGAYLAAIMPNTQFKTVLAVIMIMVLIVMLLPQPEKLNNQQVPSKNRIIAGHFLMVGVGLWGGFIQIGVGFLLMPILNRVMRLDLITTNMHKVFIVMCYTIVALSVFASQLHIAWKIGLVLAIGTSIGAWLATHFQIKQGVNTIRWTLNIVIIAFIIKLLLF